MKQIYNGIGELVELRQYMVGIFELRLNIFGGIELRYNKDVELRISVFGGFEFIRLKNGIFLSMDLMWNRNIVIIGVGLS